MSHIVQTYLLVFSLFLQGEGAGDILDSWLDVQQLGNLSRAYFNDVRKSGHTIKDDRWNYARRRGPSMLLSTKGK